MKLKSVYIYDELNHKHLPSERIEIVSLDDVKAEELGNIVRLYKGKKKLFEAKDYINWDKKVNVSFDGERPKKALITRGWEENGLVTLELEIIE